MASYASFADVLDDVPSNEADFAWTNERIAVGGETLFGALHSTNEVATFSASTAESTGSVSLENYNTWIWGMSAIGGELLLLDDGREHGYDVHVVAFDPATGAQNWSASFGQVTLNGLWCDAT